MASKRKTAARKAAAVVATADTRTRIIERSIWLFNRNGVHNVSIIRIANDLKISPGHLTYYFKRKRDLILETLSVLQDQLRVSLTRPVDMQTPKDGAEWLTQVFRTFWDVRFFFNGLAYLLSGDPQMRAQYAEFRNWVIDTLETDLEYLQSRGYLITPTPPNNFRLFAENLWNHWLNWLRMGQIESPRAATPDNAMLFDGLLHLWSLAQPWMRPGFAEEFLHAFETVMKTKALTHKTAKPKRAVSRVPVLAEG